MKIKQRYGELKWGETKKETDVCPNPTFCTRVDLI